MTIDNVVSFALKILSDYCGQSVEQKTKQDNPWSVKGKKGENKVIKFETHEGIFSSRSLIFKNLSARIL